MAQSVIKVNPTNTGSGSKAIENAAAIIRAGGVIAFPTRCLYGLGADAFNAAAVERIFRIKQRSVQKPVLILIDQYGQLERLVQRVPGIALRIMERFWPGGVTLVFDARPAVPEALTAGTGKIGVRLPGHPVARALVETFEGPITGTSANISGRPGCHRVEDLDPRVAEQLDLILDAGPLRGGKGSTVVDVTGKALRILREGAISKKDILAIDNLP